MSNLKLTKNLGQSPT